MTRFPTKDKGAFPRREPSRTHANLAKENFQSPSDVYQFHRAVEDAWKRHPAMTEGLRSNQIVPTLLFQKDLVDRDRGAEILFREPQIFSRTLKGIELPLNLEIMARRPVNLVRTPDGHSLVVMDGNHRIYKVLHSENPVNVLPAIIYASPQAFLEAHGLKVERLPNGTWGTPGPILVNGGRDKTLVQLFQTTLPSNPESW